MACNMTSTSWRRPAESQASGWSAGKWRAIAVKPEATCHGVEESASERRCVVYFRVPGSFLASWGVFHVAATAEKYTHE